MYVQNSRCHENHADKKIIYIIKGIIIYRNMKNLIRDSGMVDMPTYICLCALIVKIKGIHVKLKIKTILGRKVLSHKYIQSKVN